MKIPKLSNELVIGLFWLAIFTLLILVKVFLI